MPANLGVRNGRLMLRAVHHREPGAAPHPFTSARVRTFGKFGVAPNATFPTVRLEARIKVPSGTGLWPAFWLLPEDGSFASCSGCGRYGGWANSGEIDVMETANDATKVSGSLHYGGMWPFNVYSTNSTTLPGGASYADAFHVFRLEWSGAQMRWYVDGKLFYTARSGGGSKDRGWYALQRCLGDACWSTPARAGNAPFDKKFHLILNLALGGEGTAFTGPVTEEQVKATLATPKAMLVDWVRVWGLPA